MKILIRSILSLLLLACVGVPLSSAQESYKDVRTQEIIQFDMLLQQSDDATTTYPLATLYERILEDAVIVPRNQTSLEFERRFGEVAPSFRSAVLPNGRVSEQSSAAQALFRSTMEAEERTLFTRNMAFLDVYLVGKYLALFMNGDAGDSGFDLFVDADAVQRVLSGDPDASYSYLPPRFGQSMTNVGRYLQGSVAQAIQVDPNIRNQRIDTLAASGTVSFPEDSIPVCFVPGVVQEGAVANLDDATKRAVLGSLVDFEQAKNIAEVSTANQQLLTKKEEENPLLEAIFNNVALPNQQVCGAEFWESFCLRLDFIKSVSPLAGGYVTRPLPILASLESLENVSRKLSNTPLETKYVGRSMFSYSFANLNLLGRNYQPTFMAQLRLEPMFQQYDPRKSFDPYAFDQILQNYTSVMDGALRRISTSAVNPDRLPTNQVLTDAARDQAIAEQKQRYKSTLLMRTQIYWNATYLKVVGDRLLQMQQQVTAFVGHVEDLRSATAEFTKLPVLYSK